jgi:hypothetical protein
MLCQAIGTKAGERPHATASQAGHEAEPPLAPRHPSRQPQNAVVGFVCVKH